MKSQLFGYFVISAVEYNNSGILEEQGVTDMYVGVGRYTILNEDG